MSKRNIGVWKVQHQWILNKSTEILQTVQASLEHIKLLPTTCSEQENSSNMKSLFLECSATQRMRLGIPTHLSLGHTNFVVTRKDKGETNHRQEKKPEIVTRVLVSTNEKAYFSALFCRSGHRGKYL
jgi:hypothetical protein